MPAGGEGGAPVIAAAIGGGRVRVRPLDAAALAIFGLSAAADVACTLSLAHGFGIAVRQALAAAASATAALWQGGGDAPPPSWGALWDEHRATWRCAAALVNKETPRAWPDGRAFGRYAADVSFPVLLGVDALAAALEEQGLDDCEQSRVLGDCRSEAEYRRAGLALGTFSAECGQLLRLDRAIDRLAQAVGGAGMCFALLLAPLPAPAGGQIYEG